MNNIINFDILDYIPDIIEVIDSGTVNNFKPYKKINTIKHCIHYDCHIKIAIYNYPGETNGIYCKKHKLNGMINVTNRKCLQCNTIPSFNYSNEKKPLYCKKHKLPFMVYLKKYSCQDSNLEPFVNKTNALTN